MHRRQLLWPAILLAAVAATTPSPARIPERPTEAVKHGVQESGLVLGAYLEAVDRGELLIFGQTLDRSMIVPVRVEYLYEVGSAIPVIRVYSRLKQSIRVPNREDSEVRAISSVIDADGSISDTTAHIWMK